LQKIIENQNFMEITFKYMQVLVIKAESTEHWCN
jgi:hypothetical protein